MANILNRWREYEAGTLTPPTIIQHDEQNGEHLAWVWTGVQIVGPLSRMEYNEQDIIDTAVASTQPVQIEESTWQQ